MSIAVGNVTHQIQIDEQYFCTSTLQIEDLHALTMYAECLP